MSEPGAAHERPGDRRAERVALVGGLALAASALATILVVLLVAPTTGRALAGQALAHVVVGRETAIPAGLSLDLPVALVASLALAEDLSILLVGYAVVLALARSTLRWRWVARLVERPHPKRSRFAMRTEWGGILVLTVGLWIPFLPSGALTAALIARSVGYHPKRFLPVLALGAALADVAYALVAARFAERFGPFAVLVVAGSVVLIIAIAGLVTRLARRGSRAE